MSSKARLELLGGFQLLADGKPIALTARKPRALLAYLALGRGRPQPRDRLAALLWGDSGEQQARTSLRQALTALRRALEPLGRELIGADLELVGLESDRLELDVAEFEQSSGLRSPEGWLSAAALYRGHLLDGFSAEAAPFDQWTAAERERLRVLAVGALSALLDHQEAQGDEDRAVATAARLLSLDPLREEARRSLMRLYLRQNRVVESIQQYQTCRQLLAREVGVQPAPETERLYREILDHRRSAVAPPSESAAATTPSTAPRRDVRHAVTLFVDLDGFTAFAGEHDPEMTHDYLVRYRALVRGLVEERGGRLTNYIGARVMAVFGIPVAFENVAERACRAGLALRDEVPRVRASDEQTFQPRIGLAAGPLFADMEGDALVVSGEPVSLAARIMEAGAPGQVLMSDGVRQALGERVQATHLPDVQISAAAQPLLLWQLDALAALPGRRPPMIGRRVEMAQAKTLLDGCASKRTGQVLVIRGDAGIGKSRLLESVALEAHARGFEAHRALVLDFGVGSASPIAALVRSLLSVADSHDAATVTAAIDGAVQLGRIGAELRPHLYDLLGIDWPDELQAGESEADAENVRRAQQGALAALVGSIARQTPLLLAIEDLHWADAATLDALARVAAAARKLPVMLVLTTRPERDPFGASWRAASGQCPLATLDLSPLSDDEAHELAARYRSGDSPLVQSCIERAEGNPLFLDQLLRNAQSGSATLPGSLQSIVLARLDALAAADREALQAASVLGQRFKLDTVSGMTEQECSCAESLEHGLIRRDGDGYLFSHVLIQESIYASLARSKRNELHRRAAQWFAARDPLLAAEHLDTAQDPAAAAACAAAARAEAGRHRFERALRLAERGLALARERSVRQELLCVRGEVLREMGEAGASVQALREALQLAESEAEQARAHLALAGSLRILDQTREALSSADAAMRCAQAGDDPAELARIHLLRGNLYFALGEMDACLDAHQTARDFAVRAGNAVLEARALGNLGDTYFMCAQIRTAGEYAQRCIDLCQAQRLASVEAATRPMLAAVYMYANRPALALGACARAIELSRQIGSLRAEALSRDIASAVHYYMGDWERAMAEARLTIELCRRLGSQRFEAEALGILAAALSAHGQRDEAKSIADQALVVCRGAGERYAGPWVLSVLARVTQDHAGRRNALAEGEALLEKGCVSHAHFHYYDNAIESSLEHREWDEALRYAQAFELYTKGEPFAWADLVIRRARALVRAGQGERGAKVRAELAAVAETARAAGYHAFTAGIDLAS